LDSFVQMQARHCSAWARSKELGMVALRERGIGLRGEDVLGAFECAHFWARLPARISTGIVLTYL
jgi:hypothetical protein